MRRTGVKFDALDIARDAAGTSSSAPASTPASGRTCPPPAEEMFSAIVERFEGIEPAGEPVWSTRMVIRGLNRPAVPACAERPCRRPAPRPSKWPDGHQTCVPAARSRLTEP
jgi:hypothetical protein